MKRAGHALPLQHHADDTGRNVIAGGREARPYVPVPPGAGTAGLKNKYLAGNQKGIIFTDKLSI
jgi:hypothetical protein